jgi:hypothetical protein
MKTAMLVYGQLREYEKCMDSINKHIIEPLCPDVYVNVWSNRGHSLYSQEAGINFSFTNDIIKEEDVIKHFNPVDLNIEDYSSWLNSLEEPYKTIMACEKKSATPKNYKIKLANQMRRKYEKQHNIQYDCVIVFRPDTILFTDIPQYVIEDLNCMWQMNPPHLFNRYICHSMLHITNAKIADIFENYYDNLPELWKLPYVEPGFDTMYDCTRTETLHFKQHNVRIRAYKKYHGFIETYRQDNDFNNSVSQVDDENEKIIDAVVALATDINDEQALLFLKQKDRSYVNSIVEWCEHYHYINNSNKTHIYSCL